MVRKEGNVMSVGKRIYLKREMPDMEVMNQFKSIPASNTADVMGRSCAMNPRIRLVSSPKAQMMVGPAYTVKCRAGDNLALHAALSMCNEGDVIVVSNEEDSTRALIGEVMMAYLRYTKKVAALFWTVQSATSTRLANGIFRFTVREPPRAVLTRRDRARSMYQ